MAEPALEPDILHIRRPGSDRALCGAELGHGELSSCDSYAQAMELMRLGKRVVMCMSCLRESGRSR
jgi:hypothetical protein